MAVPTTAAATPMASAQANSAPLGWAKGGRFGTASEKSPTPVRRADADEDQGADAGGQQPGEQHQRGRGPAEPDRLHEQERSEQRGAQQGGDGREAARAADDRQRLGGGVALDEPDDQRRDPAAQGDERRLRADDGAEAERRQRGEEDAGQLDGRRRRPGLEPVGRASARPVPGR